MKLIIPPSVRITSKITYEVVYISEFKDGDQLGECRLDVKQILLNTNQSKTEMYKTFIHECHHAMSEEYKIALTESQVMKLEKGTYNMMRLNGWLK